MDRKEWIDQAKSTLESWDRAVGELEARASARKASEGARPDHHYHQTLGEAREHLGHAKHHIEKVEEIGGHAWEEVRESVEEAWTSEKKAFDDAIAALRS